jgi:hypothetical protein
MYHPIYPISSLSKSMQYHLTKYQWLLSKVAVLSLLLGMWACSTKEETIAPVTRESIDTGILTRFLAQATGAEENKVVYDEKAGLFTIDGDMLISKAEAQNHFMLNRGARTEQRRSDFLVSEEYIRHIKVYIQQGVSEGWKQAVRGAIFNWNSINGTKVRFAEVYTIDAADIKVNLMYENANWVARGYLPTSIQKPGYQVTVNNYYSNYTYEQKLFALTHEFGHTIAFWHTNQGDGSHIPGTPYWDPNSVMNSSVLPWNGFTAGDITAVRKLYPADVFGKSEKWIASPFYGNKGTFFADVTGDGKADAIAVNTNGIIIRRAGNQTFNYNETWANTPFYGNKGTFFADVDGDGKADAIAVSDNGVSVRKSTGNGFLDSQKWLYSYYGSKGTFFADVTGDGKADAIAVNENGITVRRSIGSSFMPVEQWLNTPFYGFYGTYFADVDGDKKADAIAVNYSGIDIRKSTGATLLASMNFTNRRFYGVLGTYFADVSGDKKADAIAVQSSGINVKKSLGNSTEEIVVGTPDTYVGTIGNYFADVDGNGQADAISVNGDGITVRRAFTY